MAALDRLDYKREESATLRMKVLRSVLAVGVGFALTPWLGRQALAGDSTTLAAGTSFIIRERQSAPLGCILSGIFYIVVSSCFDICFLGSMHLELVYE